MICRVLLLSHKQFLAIMGAEIAGEEFDPLSSQRAQIGDPLLLL